MIDLKSKKIILTLIEKSCEQTYLLNLLNITKRQLDYSILKINKYLSSNEQSVVVQNTSYYSLPDKSKAFLIKNLINGKIGKNYIFSTEERQKYIFLMLLYHVNTYLSSLHFLSALNISKTTLNNDIKQLELLLSSEDILITYTREKGYSLVGDELSIRNFFLRNLLKDLSNNLDDTFLYDFFLNQEKVDYLDIKNDINEIMLKNEIFLGENRKKEFIYTVIFLLPRMTKKLEYIPVISMPNKIIIKLQEYHISSELLKLYKIDDNSYEVQYLTSLLLGNSVGNRDIKTVDQELILNIVQIIISRFEQLLGIKFDNNDDISKKLYSHFRPAYYRILFRLPIINPILDKVKGEFNKLFLIVKETLKIICPIINNDIPDDEISFLTIYFAAILDENKISTNQQIVAVIVCQNGIGSSSIVYNRLKFLFPDFLFLGPMETAEALALTNFFDIIFSTVNNLVFYNQDKPFFIVSPIMSDEEEYLLLERVYSQINSYLTYPKITDLLDIFKKYGTISNENGIRKELYQYFYKTDKNTTIENPSLGIRDLIQEDLIQINVSAKDWQSALFTAALPLLQKDYINRSYIEKIIDNVNSNRTSFLISKNVSLAHAKPEDGVNSLSLSITVLKKPMLFKNDKIPTQYIFTLAAVNKTSHINAMSELVALLEMPDFYEILNTATQANEILTFIKSRFP